jgi:hypothetical protein
MIIMRRSRKKPYHFGFDGDVAQASKQIFMKMMRLCSTVFFV